VLERRPVVYRRSVKVAAVIRALETDGWQVVRTRGSHRQFKHPVKTGRVTVAGKPSAELPPKTLASIRKQARLEDLR
jgi:predicted RNA binding protein YcfA (HicA-like mRNA interferase family)